VTNITFIFETSPNAKPKEKKLRVTWHIMSPSLKKWGDTRSPCPPTNCAHVTISKQIKSLSTFCN